MNAKMFVPKRLVLTLAQLNKPKDKHLQRMDEIQREQSTFKLHFSNKNQHNDGAFFQKSVEKKVNKNFDQDL